MCEIEYWRRSCKVVVSEEGSQSLEGQLVKL